MLSRGQSLRLNSLAPIKLPPTRLPAKREVGGEETERVPMTTIRKKIAQRLVQAQQDAAILTTF